MTTAEESAQKLDAEGTAPGEAKMVAKSFAFEIPEGIKAGVTLKVRAPDGVQLHIPLPASVHGRDRMCMTKSAETGKWGIKHVERADEPAEPPAIAVEPQGQVTRRSDAELEKDLGDRNVCLVSLSTTKGDIRIRLVPSWAPNGAKRFLELVTNKYYTDLAIYRAVPKFLVQFGVTDDAKRNTCYEPIPDDQVRGVPITAGTVCFAASGPNTRATTLCIFLESFKQLGGNSWETPIGKVSPESMSVLNSLHTSYGDMPQCGGGGPDPITLEEQGNTYIKESFPACDFVASAEWILPSAA